MWRFGLPTSAAAQSHLQDRVSPNFGGRSLGKDLDE